MRIEQVESLLAGDLHFVRITTDTGVVGIGQSGCWGYPSAVDQVVKAFSRVLVGADPFRIEHHWHQMYRMGPFRGSILGGAVSAVDIALWDIKGKQLQVPVWELLGGRFRDRVRLHLLLEGAGPEDIAAHARRATADGFTAVKFDPLLAGYENASFDRLVTQAVDVTALIRETVGPDVDIIIELHRKLTALQALPLIEAFGPFRPLFVEDPIQIDSIQSQAEIARRLTMPIANGERLHSIWEFRELLEHGGAQYVRPDLGLAGGLSHCRKIAAIAESYHAAVVTHNFAGPVSTAASIQLDVAIPNFVVQEFHAVDETDTHSYARSSLRRDGGYILAPDVPGLGVELIGETLAPVNLVDDAIYKTRLRADGSIAMAV